MREHNGVEDWQLEAITGIVGIATRELGPKRVQAGAYANNVGSIHEHLKKLDLLGKGYLNHIGFSGVRQKMKCCLAR